MENHEEYRFHIEGLSVQTISMARLSEYMQHLAKLVGHQEHVHFERLEAGSINVVFRTDHEHVTTMETRLREFTHHPDAPEVLDIMRLLNKDKATAQILNAANDEIFSLPSYDMPQPLVVDEEGSLDGVVIRIGGKNPMVPVLLEDGPHAHKCEASRDLARELARHLYADTLRVTGQGRWSQAENGSWILEKFTIQQFVVLEETDLVEDMQKIRALENMGWRTMDNPLQFLHHLRHGFEGEA